MQNFPRRVLIRQLDPSRIPNIVNVPSKSGLVFKKKVRSSPQKYFWLQGVRKSRIPNSQKVKMGNTDGVRFSEPVFLAHSTGKSRIWKPAYRPLKTLGTARKPERERGGNGTTRREQDDDEDFHTRKKQLLRRNVALLLRKGWTATIGWKLTLK